MAVNEVQLTISVGDNGSLGVVAKKADAAAKATGRLSNQTGALGKTSTRTYREMQGTAGTSSNLTKNFAKQAQGIQGGLVPAYATLAANVFAITAAFGALQRAAQVEQLVEGFTFLGNVAGRTATLVAESLVKITDNALSMEQALRAASAGFSAGFDTTSMERLSQVAKNAATALGRDVGDATDRLIRGVAKLEPEILDELGIFVRLEPAVEKYASSLGKSANTLTETERRQAFLNEALAQGEKKFGNLTGEIGVDPYTKLAAAFNNLAKSFFNLLNQGLTPVINFFSENMVAFTGALILFGSSVAKQMIPALGEMAEAAERDSIRVATAAEKMSAKAAESTVEFRKEVTALGKQAPIGKNTIFSKSFLPLMEKGAASAEDFKKGITSIDASIRAQEVTSKSADTAKAARAKQQIALLEELKRKVLELQAAEEGRGALFKTTDIAESKAVGDMMAADEAAAVQNANGIIASFKAAGEGFGAYRERVKVTLADEKSLYGPGKLNAIKKFGKVAQQGFATAGVGARLFGIALTNSIPIIGQIIFIGGLLLGFFKKLFNSITAVSEEQEKLNTVLDTMAEKQDQFDKQTKKLKETANATNQAATAGEIYANTLKLQAGFTDEFTSSLIGVNEALIEDYENVGFFGALKFAVTNSVFQKANAGLTAISDSLSSIGDSIASTFREGFAELMETAELGALAKMVEDYVNEQNEAKLMQEGLTAATKAYNALLDQQGDIAERVKNQFKGGIAARLQELKDEGMTSAQAIAALNEELKTLGEQINARSGNIQEIATSFPELTQRLTKFREKLAAKDDFLELSTQIQNRINLLESIFKTEGAENPEVLSELILANENAVEGLKAFGITIEDLAENGTAPLENLRDKFKSISEQQTVLKQKSKELKLEDALVKAGAAAANADAELQNMVRTLDSFGTSGIPGLDYFDALQTAFGVANRSAAQEFKTKKAIADLEYRLMVDKLELEMSLNSTSAERKASLRAQRAQVLNTRDIVFETLDAEEKAALLRNEATFIGKQSSQRDQLVSSIKSAETLAEKIKIATDQVAEGGSFSDQFKIFGADGVTEIGSGAKALGEVIKSGLQPAIEEFKKLGPEGEVVVALLQGMQRITDSFIALGDTINSVMQDAAERLGTTVEDLVAGDESIFSKLNFKEGAQVALAATALIASGLSALMNTMAAATRNRIAHVDQEIEAEKKRDGKSAESINRISALEKKKEALKKKEFDQKKKAMMAEVVMSTAMAIAAALPLLVPPTTGIGIAMMAMIGAMGAAQLAIISGMSYAGGGAGSAGAGAPTKISAGQRGSTVDLATSQSSRGEIGFMRGERGMGQAESFRPTSAFAGYKNRAEGGNTGFIVGEQGPELFVPQTPGTIVPNDDMAEAGGANVTFNISAVDAAGVEDLLIQQRGNLIGMIREASNSYGQTFLEDVDTSIYTPQGTGVSRY